MHIYLVTNLINGKKYIGQTQTDDETYYGSGLNILKALKKYSRKNFKREILCHCSTLEELNEKEIYFIDFYDAVNSDMFYNIHPGGLGGPSRKYTQEEKDKHSLSSTKFWLGKKLSEEHKKKLAEAATGRISKLKGIKRPELAEKMKGLKYTEERKEKMAKGREKAIAKSRHPVKLFDIEGNFIQDFESSRAVAKFLNVDDSIVAYYFSGKRKSSISKNYILKKINKTEDI